MTCLAYGLQSRLPLLTGEAHWSTLRLHGLNVIVYDISDGYLTA